MTYVFEKHKSLFLLWAGKQGSQEDVRGSCCYQRREGGAGRGGFSYSVHTVCCTLSDCMQVSEKSKKIS